MSEMFRGAYAFNQPIWGWDVSKVTTMRIMFYAARAFARWIGDWDTSSVTGFDFFLSGATEWTNIFVRDPPSSDNNGPISAWSLKPGLCGENHYVSSGACVPCAAGYVNPPGDSLSGGDTTCALDPRYCAEDHHVAYGECVPCGPNLARRAGDDAPGTRSAAARRITAC